jgi:nitroimidazol reductase NimA-like FMN-containing flavoprotein (pyridoxamine 5'-phosphate oxidase superfamily)
VRLKKEVAKLVAGERVCRVATTGRSRVPHVVPVCHVLADGKLYFGSERGARKIDHLRANPYVAVTVDLYSESWDLLKGVMIQGTASLIERGPRFRTVRRLLYDKYPQYPDEAELAEGDVIVEVTPKHVFSWGFD